MTAGHPSAHLEDGRILGGDIIATPNRLLTNTDKLMLTRYAREIRAILPLMFAEAELKIKRRLWAEMDAQPLGCRACLACMAHHDYGTLCPPRS